MPLSRAPNAFLETPYLKKSRRRRAMRFPWELFYNYCIITTSPHLFRSFFSGLEVTEFFFGRCKSNRESTCEDVGTRHFLRVRPLYTLLAVNLHRRGLMVTPPQLSWEFLLLSMSRSEVPSFQAHRQKYYQKAHALWQISITTSSVLAW